jgi:shikimate 5-dehydrogenase
MAEPPNFKQELTAVPGARAMGFRGFNLTIPHKESVMEPSYRRRSSRMSFHFSREPCFSQ